MRPYILKIPAGAEDSQFFGKANVVYLSPRASVRVTVKNPDNDEAFELTPGGSARLSEFSELRISHDGTGTETFTLYVGMNTEARTAQVSGNIQPVGGSDNTANPPMIQGITDPVQVQGISNPLTPKSLSQRWYGVITDGAVYTIVSPASNVNGVEVYGLGAWGTGGQGRMMYGAAAPASVDDTALGTLLLSWTDAANGYGNDTQKVDCPVIVPPGSGIYYIQSTTNSRRVFVEYKVL